MNPFESRFFKPLDWYARSEHRCLLTEMFLNDDESKYVLCFRPLGFNEDPGKRSAYGYLRVAVTEALDSAHAQLLTQAIADELREQLSELNK
jgi:hypothetical protein